MANYRQIHVSIWKDSWFLDLEPDEKLLFIYLFSNESTSLSGIYRLSRKVVEFETGLGKNRIAEILENFSQAGKVYVENDIIWIVNMGKYHETKSVKVQVRVHKDVDLIPDCEIKRKYIAYRTENIPYPYPIDTDPQLKEEEDENEEEDVHTPTPFSTLSDAFTNKTGIFPRNLPKWNKALKEMCDQGVTPDDVVQAINELDEKGGYEIVGTWSIVNPAIRVMSKKSRQKSNSKPKTPTYAQEFS